MMNPEDFVKAYANALASQDWAQVAPLVHDDACVTFSTGRVHTGKAAVEKAFRANFAAIRNESYSVTNIHWVTKSKTFAAYLFDFNWKGYIDDKPAGGSGRGTCVLINEGNGWTLLVEHLG